MSTRADIRTLARIRADQDNSTFPTDAQLNLLIDQACKEVWYDLVRAGWPVRPSTTTLISTTSQFLTTGISGGAFIWQVLRQEGSTFYELKRIQEGDRANLLSTQGGRPEAFNVFFTTAGISLELLPIGAGHTIVVYYIPEHTGLAADGTTWEGPARSDEMVVLRTAAKAMRKEGNDQGAAQLDREYEYLKQCVQDMASWTNMRYSATIRDVGDPLGRSRMPGDFDVYGPDY